MGPEQTEAPALLQSESTGFLRSCFSLWDAFALSHFRSSSRGFPLELGIGRDCLRRSICECLHSFNLSMDCALQCSVRTSTCGGVLIPKPSSKPLPRELPYLPCAFCILALCISSPVAGSIGQQQPLSITQRRQVYWSFPVLRLVPSGHRTHPHLDPHVSTSLHQATFQLHGRSEQQQSRGSKTEETL